MSTNIFILISAVDAMNYESMAAMILQSLHSSIELGDKKDNYQQTIT